LKRGACSAVPAARQGWSVGLMPFCLSASRRIAELRKTKRIARREIAHCDHGEARAIEPAERGGNSGKASRWRGTTSDHSWRAKTVPCGLRALPSRGPINRDHAREHDCASDLCFAIGNETRNPPRPIKYGCVACAKIAKKPDRKTSGVNRPAEDFGMCHPTPPRFCDAGRRRCSGRRKFSRKGSHSKSSYSLAPAQSCSFASYICSSLLWCA
jgi:hypothetical protein